MGRARPRYVRYRKYHRLRYSRSFRVWLKEQAERLETSADALFRMMREQLLTFEQVEGMSSIPSAPEVVTVPVVTGAGRVGEVLTSTEGTWSGDPAPELVFAWLRGDDVIEGEVLEAYTLTEDDLGKVIRCQVTATNDHGESSALSNSVGPIEPADVSPANTSVPSITGTFKEGETVTHVPGVWTGTPEPEVTFEWWYEKGAAVAQLPETGTTLTLTNEHVDSKIFIRETGTNRAGSATADSAMSSSVAPKDVAPVNTEAPKFTGSAKVGQVLTAVPGTWTGLPTPTLSYQWVSSDGVAADANIAGATSSSYTITEEMVGLKIAVKETATNAAGTASSTSLYTATVEPAEEPEE